MTDIEIKHFSPEDDQSALDLEDDCIQGTSIILKYRRPNFEARSKVYENYHILCAKVKGKVVGTTAWTEKQIRLHKETTHAVYCYDTRVHPDYRKMGIAYYLMQALWKDISTSFDCIYMYIAGDNVRCLKPAQHYLGFKFLIPLTILVIPIYKRKSERRKYRYSNALEIHNNFLRNN